MGSTVALPRAFGSRFSTRVASVSFRFNRSAVYLFCIAFAALDFLDVLDFLDDTRYSIVKYLYTAAVLAIMFVYFSRWRSVDTTNYASLISLMFFVLTGCAYVMHLLIYDERDSYVSAYTAALVFSATMFIPRNAVTFDARRVVNDLTLLFSVGTVLYLIEAIVKPLDLVGSLVFVHEVQLIKSVVCVLAICLSILTGRKILALVLAAITLVALGLRPTSTLALSLTISVLLAMIFKLRVSGFRLTAVRMGRIVAITVVTIAVAIPLLQYFFFDQIADLISYFEGYLKTDVLGGYSNTQFRLSVLKLAFASFDNSSLLYGSALRGGMTVLVGEAYDWWIHLTGLGVVPIHSDFVITLVLMGFLGYGIFSLMFFVMLKPLFRELFRTQVYGYLAILYSITIIAVINLVIYCSSEPYFNYYNHAHLIWMLLLFSAIAAKSKMIVFERQ